MTREVHTGVNAGSLAVHLEFQLEPSRWFSRPMRRALVELTEIPYLQGWPSLHDSEKAFL